MKQIGFRKKSVWLFTIAMLWFTSCIDGYKDDWTFSSGVEGVELQSPPSDRVMFSKNAEGTILTITWSVVYGAGGYLFSLYDVTDPKSPIAVVENEKVDGCSKKCPLLEDTNYKVVIKSLGNEKFNNKEAVTATEVFYSTMIPAISIPNGQDLYAYFTENPIPQSDEEQAYELEAGGNYTLSEPLDLGSNWLTLRGNKVNRPTITYASDGRLICSSKGFNLKFINFDCSAVPAEEVTASLLMLNPTPDETINIEDSYVIPNPIVIQSCDIKGIARLFYDNNNAYVTSNLLIKNCIIEVNSAKECIYAYGGHISHLTISNSTIYGLVESSSYFIRYKNNARTTGGTVSLNNNTFYNLVKTGQMANYSGMNTSGITLNVALNIFVDCGNQNVIRRLSAGGNNMTKNLSYNCYWYNSAFPQVGEIDHNNGDKSGTGFGEDPAFANAAGGDFTVGASAMKILEKRCGDPRWLPEQ
jgi:hypothetical protein